MKRRSMEVALAVLMTAACLNVVGCTGIIQPTIGESGITASNDAGNAGGEEVPSTEDGMDESPAMTFGEQQESEPRPDMSGEVLQRFETSKETSNSMGQMQTLNATVELYDTENADGYNALIMVSIDGTEKYTQCIWTEEEGQYVLAVDEFTNYESKEVDGVLTIVGIRYDFGMSGKGNIDVPLEGAEPAADTEEAVPETEAVEETTEAM